MTYIDAQKRFETIAYNGLSWTYIQKPAYGDLAKLGELHPTFHKLNFEDSLSKIQLPKIDRYADHLFVVLHFPTPGKDSKFVFSQLSVYIGTNFIVTVHQGDLKPLEELFNTCKLDERTRQAVMGKSSGYLLHKIIDILVDDMLQLLMKVVGNMDDIEDTVFDGRFSISRQIALLRREIITLRRIVIHLRRTLVDLTKEVQRFSSEDLTLFYKDVQDHVEKVYETLEEAMETVEVFKDTEFVLSTVKTNKILAILTIIFTLSIPVTIISTIYGMNVPIPGGLETGPWTQLGPYTTLIFVLAISVASAGLMLLYFHKMSWF